MNGNDIRQEFVQPPHKRFKFKLGKSFATSLTGFIAGFIVASIVLIPLVMFLVKYSQGVPR